MRSYIYDVSKTGLQTVVPVVQQCCLLMERPRIWKLFSPRNWMIWQFQSGGEVPEILRELLVFGLHWNSERRF